MKKAPKGTMGLWTLCDTDTWTALAISDTVCSYYIRFWPKFQEESGRCFALAAPIIELHTKELVV